LRPGERLDFNNDGLINGQDTGKYVNMISRSCMTSGIAPFSQQ